MKYDRKEPCPIRHENGNCTCIGGFCTAVPDPVCEGVRSAYDSGYRTGLLKAKEAERDGRWISEKCNHKPCRIKNPEKWVTYKCSVCGYSNGRKQSNYCPNCGNHMDKEAEHEAGTN